MAIRTVNIKAESVVAAMLSLLRLIGKILGALGAKVKSVALEMADEIPYEIMDRQAPLGLVCEEVWASQQLS